MDQNTIFPLAKFVVSQAKISRVVVELIVVELGLR